MVDNITLLTPGEYLKRGNSGKFAKVVRTHDVLTLCSAHVDRHFCSLFSWE